MRRAKFGPAPRFSPEDAARALWALGKRTGRARLARHLGIGEGTMRTILSSLTSSGLVESAPMGAKLTGKGFLAASKIRENVRAVKEAAPSRLTCNEAAHSMHLRGARLPKNSLELRDELVRVGAKGALLLAFNGSELTIPPYHARTHHEFARELESISKQFVLKKGDAVIVCFGGDKPTRARALWRAASLLLV